MKRFKSLREAKRYAESQNVHFERVKIYHKRGGKLWYVGTYIEWLNK